MSRTKKRRIDPVAAAETWLAENKPGQKATINDVARLAGVSKKTISRIINQSPLVKAKTREDVQTIIDTIGYVPDVQARGLNFKHSFLVGMIYDNPNPQYVVNMQQGVLDGLSGSSFELVVHPCDRRDPDFIQRARVFIERQKLYGVVLTPSVSEDDEMAKMLIEVGCKFVRIASVSLDEPEHMMVTNDRAGAFSAAQHLAQLGHKEIAFVSGRKGFRSSVERKAGFEEGLRRHDIELPNRLCVSGDYTFESGVSAGKALLKMSPRPTAIFAANDEMAAGVLQALRLSGLKAPEAVSVVGFDDFQIASTTWPRLTTVHSPTRDIGKRAALRLLDSNSDAETLEPVTPWLVERESSGPPPE